MGEVKISICIPTFNRSKYLEINLVNIKDIITSLKIESKVEIVVSNNNSTDDTKDVLSRFYNKFSDSLLLSFWNQKESLIIQKNQIFVIEKAKFEFFMWLGDDDFFDIEYLKFVFKLLEKDATINVIVPSIRSIDIYGHKIEGGDRDLNVSSRKFKASFKSSLYISWRGHQMSGLIFKKNILKNYKSLLVNNMYPFIFFAAYGALSNNSYHLTNFPISVTQPGQAKKAWSYGKDGLLNEIFDNYIRLPLSYFKITQLQLHHYRKQTWRLWMYYEKGNRAFFRAFMSILLAKNSTLLFKLIFPFWVILLQVILFLRKRVKKIVIH